jgi:hypothetical protein
MIELPGAYQSVPEEFCSIFSSPDRSMDMKEKYKLKKSEPAQYNKHEEQGSRYRRIPMTIVGKPVLQEAQK